LRSRLDVAADLGADLGADLEAINCRNALVGGRCTAARGVRGHYYQWARADRKVR
jgi:hypothetical protein